MYPSNHTVTVIEGPICRDHSKIIRVGKGAHPSTTIWPGCYSSSAAAAPGRCNASLAAPRYGPSESRPARSMMRVGWRRGSDADRTQFFIAVHWIKLSVSRSPRLYSRLLLVRRSTASVCLGCTRQSESRCSRSRKAHNTPSPGQPQLCPSLAG